MNKKIVIIRLIAFAIDAFISFLIAVYVFPTHYFNGEFIAGSYGSLIAYLLIPLVIFDQPFEIFVASAYLLAYFICFETIFKSSPGKMIFGLKVTYNNQIVVRFCQAIDRNLLRLIPFNWYSLITKSESWNNSAVECQVIQVAYYGDLFNPPKIRLRAKALKNKSIMNLKKANVKDFMVFENIIKIIFLLVLSYVRLYQLFGNAYGDTDENLLYLRGYVGIMCFIILAYRKFINSEKTEAIIYFCLVLFYQPFLEIKLGIYSVIADCLIGSILAASLISEKFKVMFKSWLIESLNKPGK